MIKKEDKGYSRDKENLVKNTNRTKRINTHIERTLQTNWEMDGLVYILFSFFYTNPYDTNTLQIVFIPFYISTVGAYDLSFYKRGQKVKKSLFSQD